MKIIVCLDDDKGMLFNRRRQSQDTFVRRDIIENLRGSRLWMNNYSFKQLKECNQALITVDEQFMELAGAEDYCFVENLPLHSYEEKITELIVYYWNRRYPADLYLDLDLQQWEVAEQQEFAGYSHDKITKIVYVKNKNM